MSVNVNAQGKVYEERQIDNYLSIPDFIKAVRAAAKGLENASIEAEHAYEYGDCSARIMVTGYRPATAAELLEAEERRIRHEVRNELLNQNSVEMQRLIEAEVNRRLNARQGP
jgi:hypothetical protein